MKIRDFKRHTIVRSNPTHRDDYTAYRSYLCADFEGRCAYCNLHHHSITTPYEIDHFIPVKAFEGIKDELLTDYNNLVYSCKKCNIAKRHQFSGDLSLPNPTNELFYDPCKRDYNDVFFRDEHGAIASHDPKGQEMIDRLKLYRPIHILGWLCEEIVYTIDQLQAAIDAEQDAERKRVLQEAKSKMDSQYVKYNRLFLASYNDKAFTIERMEQVV